MFVIVSVLLYGAVGVVVFAFVVLAGVGFSDLGWLTGGVLFRLRLLSCSCIDCGCLSCLRCGSLLFSVGGFRRFVLVTTVYIVSACWGVLLGWCLRVVFLLARGLVLFGWIC